jgi:hypothetical protein
MVTMFNRLLTLTFSRSSGFKNTLPHILSLLHARTGQSQCVHCPLYHVHTVSILAIVYVQFCTDELSGLCVLLIAPQQP